MKELINLKELSIEELLVINGGDKFMFHLGRAIGKIAAAIDNAVDDFVAAQAEDVYRCKI
ncbi:hypothetical protein [Roseimarinus sediminis]|uniref:hypothetical protein n=1 Tax=Roseimarinus sediminis TaxID=1610899 RepID=UPI003D1C43A7